MRPQIRHRSRHRARESANDGRAQEIAYGDGTRLVDHYSQDFVGEPPGVVCKVVKGVDRLEPERWEVE